MPIHVRRLPSNVQAERLKGGGRPSEHASNRRTSEHSLEEAQKTCQEADHLRT